MIVTVPIMAMSQGNPTEATIGPVIAGPLDRKDHIQHLKEANKQHHTLKLPLSLASL